MKPFPAKQVANLILTAALAWLWFGGGSGAAPFVPSPGQISVLIVDETADYGKPEYRDYLNVLNSSAVVDYLNGHCAKVNGSPEWRHWDKDTDVSNELPKWQDAMKLERKSLPWLYVTNGGSSWGGPLPKTVDETLALLAKWGGA